MNNDTPVKFAAKVDVRKVKYSKPTSLGVDYSNEIDVWAKLEFKSRKQIDRLKHNRPFDEHCTYQDLKSIYYAIREKLD